MTLISCELLKQQYSYNKETGIFTRLVDHGYRYKKGEVSNSIHKGTGYIRIQILGHRYQAHRLAWLYVYGSFPEQFIDHINRIKSDNRISNLRECNQAQNKANVSKMGGIYKGVVRHKSGGFQSQIGINGKTRYIGYFEDAISAAKAYDDAAIKLFGAFANLNFNESAAIAKHGVTS